MTSTPVERVSRLMSCLIANCSYQYAPVDCPMKANPTASAVRFLYAFFVNISHYRLSATEMLYDQLIRT